MFSNCVENSFILSLIKKNRKAYLIIKNYFLFFVIKNIKQSVFREYFLVILYYFHLFYDDCLKKKSYKHIRLMIKNKTLNTKIICKTYLKILKIG